MSTATATETKDRISEIKTAIKDTLAENDVIVDSIKVEDGVSMIETKQFDAMKANNAKVAEMRSVLAELEGHEGHKGWAGAPAGDPTAFAAAIGQELAKGGERKSLGRQFVESDEFKALRGGAAGYDMPVPFEVKGRDFWLPAMAAKDVYSTLPTGTPGTFGSVQRDATVPRAHRSLRVRSLFPARGTSAAVIEFFRVTGFTNAASVVPERDGSQFGAKPQSGLTFEGQQAVVRTIAHWEAAHRNTLRNEPELEGIVDDELMYGLQLVEDDQILNGTGTGEDLLGILNTPNVQTYDWSDGETAPVADTRADAIRRAATKAFLANYEPTGVVLHPSDWEKVELTKDENGDYIIALAVAIGAEKRIWRMNVVDTPAIDEGTALVGAFGLGAQLYDAEQGHIRISEHHEDFFVRNAIVILAEESLALATKRPESFVKVTFDAAPS